MQASFPPQILCGRAHPKQEALQCRTVSIPSAHSTIMNADSTRAAGASWSMPIPFMHLDMLGRKGIRRFQDSRPGQGSLDDMGISRQLLFGARRELMLPRLCLPKPCIDCWYLSLLYSGLVLLQLYSRTIQRGPLRPQSTLLLCLSSQSSAHASGRRLQ